MVKARKIVLAKRFDGMPKVNDFEIIEEELRAIKDGEMLLKAEYLTVDPYMRIVSEEMNIGETMVGHQAAEVIESKNADYPVGTKVLCRHGWTSHSISDGVNPGFASGDVCSPLRKLDFPDRIPTSAALGVLGLTGVTAYFGVIDVCRPKEGETMFVNTAAGAVGSLVGQIAKLKGVKTIGCTSTDEKVVFLKEYGYDEVFNYKKEDLDAALKRTAPNGIDCYFDNVGGMFSSTVMKFLNFGARVAVCGYVSQYNRLKDKEKVPAHGDILVFQSITIKGFMFWEYRSQFPKAYDDMIKWLKEGKLKHKEWITDGFENMPKAFIGQLSGENCGKCIVKA